MKKQFTIFLILTFVLGLVPVNFSFAITQNQINAEVQIVCPDNYGNWFSGSGTIIDPKGIILTNKHVVSDQYGGIIKTCFIGFTESINQEPNFGTLGNYNLAEVKYYTTMDDMDAAILYLNNTANKNYAYVDIWNSNSNSLQFGHKIEVIGFPSIGGATITYTSGDFSGFGSLSDGTQNYIKATTPLEHGNSGGAAYNPASKFIGIPTMVVAGTLNSLSYILSINSIVSWLLGVLGNNYQEQIIKQEPIIEEPNKNIQADITPPDISQIDLQFYDCSKFYPEKDSSGQAQAYPTVNGIKGNAGTVLTPGRCTPISYDITKSFRYDPQTIYVKLKMLENVKDDIFTVGWLWSKEIQADPLKKAFQNHTIAPGTAWIELDDANGFFRPFPFLGVTDYGVLNFSLQIADKAGNLSDTKIWKYNYSSLSNDNIDYVFSKKQIGKILLQVESHGETWYVNPKDNKRYYMANGNEAYQIMRYLGVGITNKDLAKIKADKNLAKKFSGKIFLQVEVKGEAYYIDFNGVAHYLKDGAAAYTIMRELGLGIKNNDLSKIPEGSL
ncbi:MAG: serine protease [bacterium]|nr:serine protease [bacterium]